MLNSKSKISIPLPPNSTIGVFGGGQLGGMACFAAHKLGYHTVIFSDVKNSPASFVSDKTIVADYKDEEAVLRFANQIDVATFEFENIPVSAVDFVSNVKSVYPGSQVLGITQNRLNEKDFLKNNNIAVTNYYSVSDLEELKNALKAMNSQKAILKTTTLGYDGKGQFRLSKNSDLKELGDIWQQNQNRQMILEEFVEFDQEISVIAARNIREEICCYDPLTNIHKDGILDLSIYPAKVSNTVVKNAKKIAADIVKKLDLIGVLAIEFFVLKDGNLLVNELAPRPHNSGHFSMDACLTSQFEQLVRSITGLPFGGIEFHSTGYMKNLIGNEVNNIDKYIQNEKAKIHLYGKKDVKEGRKMGHVNVIDSMNSY